VGAEGTVGLITYMRTDSPRIAPEAIAGAREWIGKQLGRKVPAQGTPNVYKGKKAAQDAHEAIRPTDVSRTPESIARYLTEEQLKLYRLIWQRFVASQMMPAVFDVTTAKIAAVSAKTGKTYDFRLSGIGAALRWIPEGLRGCRGKKDEEDESANKLPNLDNVKKLELEKLDSEQHFTQPPPRFNEASLVKVLEERGIGGPSTYASIINTIQDREYVTKISGRFYPTEIGMVVCDLLVKNFPYIFDIAYTAKLEEELDEIEEGKEKWTDLLNGFYGHFVEELKDAGAKMEDIKRMEKKTDEKCDLCGSPLVLKWGKFGSFYACSAPYNKKDKSSCTFTKENTAGKPDMNTPEGQEASRAGGVLRQLRPGDGAEARPLRALHVVPRLQRGSALQDLPQADQQAAAESGRAAAHRRGLPAVRQAAGVAPGSVWRVCLLLRLSQVQVCEAEHHRGPQVPQVRRGRPGRTQGAPGEHLLGLHQLSEVRLSPRTTSRWPRSARSAAALTWWRRR
jgi:DNA topoisomerase-1